MSRKEDNKLVHAKSFRAPPFPHVLQAVAKPMKHVFLAAHAATLPLQDPSSLMKSEPDPVLPFCRMFSDGKPVTALFWKNTLETRLWLVAPYGPRWPRRNTSRLKKFDFCLEFIQARF